VKSTRLSRSKATKPPPPTHEQIAALAHELWQERGCPEGSDIDIWLEAERQLNGFPNMETEADPIPADPANPLPESDPALTPETDRELNEIGGGTDSDQRSPTAFNV
jgi:hypothetical protein